MNTVIFKKEYHGYEELFDYFRDMDEAVRSDFNDKAEILNGEFSGTVKVTIEYVKEDET
jgi:hypothetical protein